MLARIWSKRSNPLLLMGMKTCIVSSEINMVVSRKIENQSTSRSICITPDHILKESFILPQEHWFHYIHSSFTHSNQNLPGNKLLCFLYLRMDKDNVVHLHNGVLLCVKKKWLDEIFRQINGTRKNHPEWGNPDSEKQIWYALTRKWILLLNKR